MVCSSRIAVAAALLALTVTPEASGGHVPVPQSDVKPKPTFWLIPHTHWEGAVFKTREAYLDMGLQNILTAVRLLKEHPNYRFALDQVAYFRPFLERYPEEAASFRKFVAEGRLQIVGGMDVMPDDNMPSGESFVRQLLYAKGYCRDALGVDVKVGWLLDTFGHHAQMPQVLRLAGFDSFWFFRGVENRDKMPSESIWEGIDGTRIPAFWLPYAYGHLYGPPRDLAGFSGFMKQRWDSLGPFSRGGDRVGLAGVDVSEPELHVSELVDQFNRQPDMPFTLRIGVPTDFEKVVGTRKDLPVITGERNPLFQGIYSSRIELKQRMRNMERLLTTAEKLGALSNLVGVRTDDEMTWRAWEPVLFNQTHDLASGVMTDPVYEDTVRSYDYSKRLAEEMIEMRLDAVLGHVDTRGEGIPVAVFNTLGWPRTDVAEAEVGFTEVGVKDFRVVDTDGRAVPAQILATHPYSDGGLKRIKVAFLARDVPAMGYSVYHVVPLRVAEQLKTAAESKAGNSLENEYYRVAIDPLTGAVTGIVEKSTNWSVLSKPGNVAAREEDNGDFWELYKNLDGFQNVVMTRPLPVPTADKAQFSDKFTGTAGTVRQGPVFSEFKVKHPYGNNTFTTTVRLYNGVRRVDFATQILNNDKRVRYRLLFPTAIANGKAFHEIPFGAVDRPQSQEFPAQNWVDYGDGTKGVALLNRGMPGNNVADGTLMLSLMRSTSIQFYAEDGSFEKGMTSDSGLELGKELSFDYALVPHAGDWREAGVFRAGLEFNNPLIVRKAAAHKGQLPASWGLLDVSPANVVVSAVKPAKDGSTVIRVYEAIGKAVQGATISLHAKVIGAYEANLMEDSGKKLKVQNDTVTFDLHPFEIKTFKVRLRGVGAGR
jgi:alpha-mannosidase